MKSQRIAAVACFLMMFACSSPPNNTSFVERAYSDVYESGYLDSLFQVHNDKVLTVNFAGRNDTTVSIPNRKEAQIDVRYYQDSLGVKGGISSCKIINDSVFVISSRAGEVAVYDRQNNQVLHYFGEGRGPGEFSTPSDIQVYNNKMIIVDPNLGRASLFEDFQFKRALPYKTISSSSTHTIGMNKEGISVMSSDYNSDQIALLNIPFDESAGFITVPLQKWFYDEKMFLYNGFMIRKSDAFTVIASPGAPYFLVYDQKMQLVKIIQLNFDSPISLDTRGASSTSMRNLALQLYGMVIRENTLYFLTKFANYLGHVSLDKNDDWGFIDLNRFEDEGEATMEQKIKLIISDFDVYDDTILACSQNGVEIDILRIVSP